MGGDALLPLTMMASILAGGVAATYACDLRAPVHWRLAAGSCLGLGVFGLAGLLLASWLGLSSRAALLAAGLTLGLTGLMGIGAYREAARRDVHSLVAMLRPRAVSWREAAAWRVTSIARGLACVAGIVVIWRVASRVMIVRPDGVFTGVSHNLGDLPFHLSVINRLLAGSAIPPDHPSFAGAAFTYPYLTDLIAALFVAAGTPVQQLFVWSTWLLTIALAVLVFRWTLTLTGSRGAACLAPVLMLSSGGLGWWRLLDEAWRAPDGLWSVFRLTHDYTITADNAFRWGNAITTLLVPQRGLLLGLPIAVIVFQQWWQAGESGVDEPARRRVLWAAGAIAGLLPLVHAHTYAVVLGVGVWQMVIARAYRTWWPFFVVALALGLPQVWSVTRASEVHAQSMIAWSVGWDHGEQPVIRFWLMNTGLVIPLIVLAFAWRRGTPPVPAPLLRYYAPFLLCFAIANVVRLAPWIWDNVKVLIYWFVASVPVIALVLVRLAHGARWRQVAVAGGVVSLTLAGFLDIVRVATHRVEATIVDRAGIAFAERVRAVTEHEALVLHAPTYAHPIVLTGRQSFMGYPGHIWSHGLDPGPRGADVSAIYAGADQSMALLTAHRIDYVVVGPLERRLLKVNDAFFARLVAVAESPGYQLYRVAHD